jgi:hypothetical protein
MEAALQDLGGAAAHADARCRHAEATDAPARRAHRGYVNLEMALADAEVAAGAARGLAHRAALIRGS